MELWRLLLPSPLADIAGPVLVQGASSAAPDAVNILVALGRVLRKVDPRAEHAPNVRVPLVKALVDDGVHERRAYGVKKPPSFNTSTDQNNTHTRTGKCIQYETNKSCKIASYQQIWMEICIIYTSILNCWGF